MSDLIINYPDMQMDVSRYGEVVDVNLVRDKGTGKSKGFAFLAYEDQRSTILAVGQYSSSEVIWMTENIAVI